jgi:hypothetical protein
MFIPISKVNAAQRLVYGLATAEIEDRSGEICDYASTKPLYEKWSKEIAESTRGKSLGNLRAMHGPVAAGKVTAIDFNDGAKQIEICAKVVDEAEWEKVSEGVYTGFSQGGVYARRWTDAKGLTRYTAEPSEISLVDLPCLPQARFEMIKADGTIETRRFGGGLNIVDRFEGLAQELDRLQSVAALENAIEENDPDIPAKLRDLVARASALLRAVTSEPTAECAQDDCVSRPPPAAAAAATKTASACQPTLFKASDRNSDPDQHRIQRLHDTAVELGAACGAQKFMSGGLEKRFDLLAATLADVLQRVKHIEEQPLPLPLAGRLRAIGKNQDTDDDHRSGDAIEKLFSDPEALSVLAIKFAQRNGRAPAR